MLNKTLFLILFTLIAQIVSAQQTPKQIAKGVVNGAAVELPKPKYPSAAQAIGATGEVKVQVTIDEQGNVIAVQAISGHPLLRQVSEQAAWQAKFKPTTLSGNAVKVSGVIVYNFVPASKTDVDDDKKYFWTAGFLLRFIQDAEPEFIREIGDEKDWDELLTGLAQDIPEEFKSETELFENLSKSKNAERQQAAAVLNNSFKKHFSGAGLNDYEIGETLAVIFAQVMKKGLSLGGKNFQPNEAILKSSLTRLKEILKNEQTNLPPETLKQFRQVASFADLPNLYSDESFAELFTAISAVFTNFDAEQKEK